VVVQVVVVVKVAQVLQAILVHFHQQKGKQVVMATTQEQELVLSAVAVVVQILSVELVAVGMEKHLL
jgi:hypothetical protein